MMHKFFPKSQRPDIAIDFGTANTRIVTTQEGIIFDEPSICCFAGSPHDGKLVTAGLQAAKMVGHMTGDLRVARPLKRGVLDDIDTARHFLRHAIGTGTGTKRISGLTAIIGVPIDATKAERNALTTAATDVGLKSVRLWDEPLAAAMGAGIDTTLPNGTLLVECGAGITEAAILSLGGICGRRSVRIGGDSLDQSIIDHLHSRLKFQIGEVTAERVKRQLLECLGDDMMSSVPIDIKGLNLLSGLPENISVPADQLAPVVDRHVGHITEIVLDLLGSAPPDLCHDIHESGILLTGGSASMSLIGKALTDSTGLQTVIASQEKNCVVEGLLQAIRH